jgi:hypothetical protein
MVFEPSFPRGGREKINAAAAPEKPLKRKQVDDVNMSSFTSFIS